MNSNIIVTGSPTNTKSGLERRTVVFKHAIEILNDGDLSSKVMRACLRQIIAQKVLVDIIVLNFYLLLFKV